jgi:hypothetical protein
MHPMTRPHRTTFAVLAAAVVGLPLSLMATTTAPAAASPAPITIAYVTDLTGEGGSQNST